MNRVNNPYNMALTNSRAFMMVFSKKCDVIENKEFLRAFAHTNYKISYSKKCRGIILSVSHKFIDGDGLRCLPNFIEFPQSIEYPENCDFEIDDYAVRYYSRKLCLKNLGDNSYTQKFIQNLINSNTIKGKNIGIVVKLFNSEFLSAKDLIGNSISVNLYSKRRAKTLSHLDKRKWKETLLNDAIKLNKIMSKKPISDSKFDSFVVSSMGNMTNNKGLNCIYGATPTNPSYVNIFLWFYGDRQHLVVCGHKEHSLIELPLNTFNDLGRF